MRIHVSVIAALTLAGTASAQFARLPQQIDDPNAMSYSPRVASDGDLCAVVYVNTNDQTVRLVVSDGRGTVWSPPLRVDQDPLATGKLLGDHSVLVQDNRVYVAWVDHRNGPTRADLFMNVYDGATGQFAGERWVDKGYPQGNGFVSEWDMAVSAAAGKRYAHFLVMSSGLNPQVIVDDLWLVTTENDGGSFSVPRNLTPGLVRASPLRFDLAAERSNVHLAWVDNRSNPGLLTGREVFYQRSTDAGATLLPQDVALDLSGPGVGQVDPGLDIEISPSTVAVAWVEHTPTSVGTDRLRVNVSTDGGAMFQGDHLVGQYSLTDTWIGAPQLTVEPDTGHVVVAWGDYRGGTPSTVPLKAFAATSIDGGVSWLPDAQLSPAGATHIAAVHARCHVFDGTAAVTVTWTDVATGFFTGTFASHSRDGGLTWEPPLRLADDLEHARFAYNHRYGNHVVAWLSTNPFGGPPHHVWTGGFRPQAIAPVGWTSGSIDARFRLTGFSGQPGLGAVLLSFAPGSAVIPDGRDLGLTVDALFIGSASLITTVFGAALGPDGKGATPPLVLNAPPGLTVQAAAVALLPTGPDELTDVVQVVVQ